MASKQSFKGEGKTFQGPLKIPYALERMSGNTRYIVSPFHFPPSIPNSAHAVFLALVMHDDGSVVQEIL